jgi:hypothetical protein
MHYLSAFFDIKLYMFRTHLLSVIRSLNNVSTGNVIGYTVILTVDLTSIEST